MREKTDLSDAGLTAVLEIVWRRRKIAITVAGILFGLLSIAILNLTPRYSTDALILLMSGRTTELHDSRSASTTPITDPSVVRSEVEIFRSDALCNRVIDRLNLQDVPEFSNTGSKLGIRSILNTIFGSRSGGRRDISDDEILRDRVLAVYKSRLAVSSSDGRSPTLRVAFWAGEPRIASAIVNTHVKVYLEHQAERRIDMQRASTDWLGSELEVRSKELREAEAALQSFRDKSGLIFAQRQPVQQQSIVEQELFQRSEQLTAARADVLRHTARLDQVRKALDQGLRYTPSEILDSDVFIKLRERETEAHARLEQAIALYGENSEPLGRARLELQGVKDAVRRELERVSGNVAADLSAATGRVKLLETEVAQVKERTLQRERAEAELRRHEAQVVAKRSVYDAVLNRYSVLLAEQRFEGADAKLISEARVPTGPSFPMTDLFLVIAFCASLVVGATSAVGQELMDKPAPGLDELANLLRLRPLVMIPLPADETNHLPGELWKALFWERIRTVRSMLPEFGSETGVTVVVASTLPDEGRSLVAASLARAVAKTNIPTLLIDGDLRCSNAAAMAGVGDVRIGLSDVLLQRANVNDAIVPVDGGLLAVLPAKPVPHSSIDLIATDKMRSLLAELRRRYPVIIIDAPPLGIVGDALAFSTFADATILVARASKTPLSLLQQAVTRLREHGSNIAGIIVTGPEREHARILGRPDVRRYYLDSLQLETSQAIHGKIVALERRRSGPPDPGIRTIGPSGS